MDDYDLTDGEIFYQGKQPSSTPQFDLLHYLVEVLNWFYRKENWFIGGDLGIVYSQEEYLAIGLGVFKRVVLTPAQRRAQHIYRASLPDWPPPAVVFEISSENTWTQDLGSNLKRYEALGAKEYFAYDPNTPQVWQDRSRRLRGWSYAAGSAHEMTPDAQGRLWSEELESWLVPDDQYLRLLDRQGLRCLTKDEAAFAKLRELGFDPEKL